ncbi:putative membrane protein [Escherichia coli 88.1042]|nr:putative membrane protein [Escherichia coli 88.1042]
MIGINDNLEGFIAYFFDLLQGIDFYHFVIIFQLPKAL